MKKEKSCGAIIYKKENNRLLFLLIQQKAGHFGFPKGHVEKNETEEETALREIKEETNLEVLLDTSFRVVTTYSPAQGVIKDVVFFLATPLNENIIAQVEEVASILWCDYEKANILLTHKDNKKILEQAKEFILNK